MNTDEYVNPGTLGDILTLEEVAKILRVSVNTVKRFGKQPNNPLLIINLSFTKKPMPRVKKEDLKVWIDARPERTVNETQSS